MARWAVEHASNPIEVEPWQKADLASLGLTPEQASRQAWWIDPAGRSRSGHSAVGAALMACGGMWRLCGWIFLLPPPVAWIAAACYRLLLGFRRHLPGITPACLESYPWDHRRHRSCR